MKKLTASDAAGDGFGYSVAINGDTAVAGAPGEDIGGEDAGVAYITSTVIESMPPGKGDDGLVGTPPASGFGLVTFGGTIEQLRDSLAIACPSGKPRRPRDACRRASGSPVGVCRQTGPGLPLGRPRSSACSLAGGPTGGVLGVAAPEQRRSLGASARPTSCAAPGVVHRLPGRCAYLSSQPH